MGNKGLVCCGASFSGSLASDVPIAWALPSRPRLTAHYPVFPIEHSEEILVIHHEYPYRTNTTFTCHAFSHFSLPAWLGMSVETIYIK